MSGVTTCWNHVQKCEETRVLFGGTSSTPNSKDQSIEWFDDEADYTL
jgi:hypothetical protein